MTDLGDLIRNVRFSSVRLAEAYDMDQVDYLLDRLLAAAEDGEPLAPILEGVEINQVRVREGYDIGEVDSFLEQLRAAPEPPAPAPGPGPTPVVADRRGLLSRLFGRR